MSAHICLYMISCTVHTPDWVTRSKFFKQKTSFLKESLKTLDNTRTQSIVTLFNPMEITYDFTCADTLVLIHVCLFSPLICRISGLGVWIIFPQWRFKVAAFPSLFLSFLIENDLSELSVLQKRKRKLKYKLVEYSNQRHANTINAIKGTLL